MVGRWENQGKEEVSSVWAPFWWPLGRSAVANVCQNDIAGFGPLGSAVMGGFACLSALQSTLGKISSRKCVSLCESLFLGCWERWGGFQSARRTGNFREVLMQFSGKEERCDILPVYPNLHPHLMIGCQSNSLDRQPFSRIISLIKLLSLTLIELFFTVLKWFSTTNRLDLLSHAERLFL